MNDPFRDHLAQALGGGYTLDRELAGGGMSRVFVATEHALSRAVVVKVLRPDLAADVNRERFRREIMLVAQLQHPLIVPVLSAGEQGELLWYTMPFVEGESLREEIRRGTPASIRTAIRVLHDVLDALSYAHARGVIHRDIKPGNVLRHGNHSLVTDFGVAKALSAALPSSGATSAGIAIGTPAYMAPEQLAADPTANHRIDIYAAGLVVYEVLTGAQAFAESSPQATMAAQLTRMPRDLAEVRPDVPAPLSALILRMLAKSPDDRPQSARDALDELDAIITPTGVTAPRPIGKSSRKSRRLALAAIAVVAAAGAVVFATTTTKPVTSAKGAGDSGVSAGVSAGASAIAVAQPAVAATPAPTPSPGGDASTKVAPTAPTKVAPARTTAAGAVSDTSPKATELAAKSGASARSGARDTTRRKRAAARPAVPLLNRRVAVLPIRARSDRETVSRAVPAIEDSLQRALVAAGYTLATDRELLRLIAQQNMVSGGLRRAAQSLGIGAVVTIEVAARGDEVSATTQVLDVWRAQTASARESADLDKAMELLGIVRNASRSLDRVSWRSPTDPRRVLLFEVENQTRIDSLSIVGRQLDDSLRAAIGRFGAVAVPLDSLLRATKDVTERRQLAVRRGAGAIVAATMYRTRVDSVMIRLSVRDMSEERTLPAVEVRAHSSSLTPAASELASRLRELLGQVNWGPKASP